MRSDDFSDYEDGWYECGTAKLSVGKKRHVLVRVIGARITDPDTIEILEARVANSADASQSPAPESDYQSQSAV